MTLDFPTANPNPKTKGVIKSRNEDFRVDECLKESFSGEGEHLWIYLEKNGQNTEYVAKQLARFFNVKPMDIGFSGLKDRWAITRQWFSAYVRNRSFESELDPAIEGVRLIKVERHNKKLRRGSHDSNVFEIVVRDIESPQGLEQRLHDIKMRGFPNYFGPQRFGRNGENLERALRWFKGDIKASRSQRSFYLSAVRSYLFNSMLAEKVRDGSWLTAPPGPLFGDEVPGVEPFSEYEKAFFELHSEMVAGLHKNRMTLSRRPYKMLPTSLEWTLSTNSLSLSFGLETGAFATSLLAELFVVQDQSAESWGE